MRRCCFPALVPGLFLVAALTASRPASAGPYAAVDLDVGAPLYFTDASYALGAGGRLGWRFDVGPAWIAPEVGAGYAGFMDSHPILGVHHVARVFGGARFGLPGRVQPSFYGHLGAGWLDAQQVGPAFDVGLALDLALVPRFNFGAHVGYDVVAVWAGADPVTGPIPPYVVRWIDVGLHASVAFF
jgi:hypothetical protein